MDSSSVFVPDNYSDLSDWLNTLGSNFSAAELHGAIVGGLCGKIRLEPLEWVDFIFSFLGRSDQQTDNIDHYIVEVTGSLTLNQLKNLLSDDLSFEPFLPDDDEEIEFRIESVSLWCRGFLGGFAEAHLYESNNLSDSDLKNKKNLSNDDFPENVKEALNDFGSISKVALFDEEGNRYSDQVEFFEQAEKDLVEVIEFIRLATLTVFAEYGHVENLERPIRSSSSISDLEQPSDPDNKTVH